MLHFDCWTELITAQNYSDHTMQKCVLASPARWCRTNRRTQTRTPHRAASEPAYVFVRVKNAGCTNMRSSLLVCALTHTQPHTPTRPICCGTVVSDEDARKETQNAWTDRKGYCATERDRCCRTVLCIFSLNTLLANKLYNMKLSSTVLTTRQPLTLVEFIEFYCCVCVYASFDEIC